MDRAAVALLVLLWGSVPVGAGVERFVIGNAERPWQEWGTLHAMDYQAEPGWLQPRQTHMETNILHGLFAEGRLFVGSSPALWQGFRPDQDARIWSPNIPSAENDQLVRLADALADTLSLDYFNRLLSNAGVSITVDLGIPYPIRRIDFYPLDFGRHVDLFAKGYELLGSDGSDEDTDARGQPIYSLLSAVPDNTQQVVQDSSFRPQHLRYVKLVSTSPQPFEIDQLALRGEGFVRRAEFTSQILDVGRLANFGRVLWHARQDSGSRFEVRTRIGRDQTTLVYHRINELGEEEEITGLTDAQNLQTYNALPDAGKGSVADDTQNWTLWSVPYDSSGQALSVQGPGQYMQVRAVLETQAAQGRALLDSLALEYSVPTLGRRISGRIEPRQGLELGVSRTLVYTVSPQIGPEDTGFDMVEIDVPAPAALRQVSLAGRVLGSDEYSAESGPEALRVRLLQARIDSADQVLVLSFDTTVLVYGTAFTGRVRASWRSDVLPQPIEEEVLGELTVLGAPGSLGRVLAGVQASPSVFTPNGDRINDEVAIRFEVLQVLRGAPLVVQVHDLSGRPVARLLEQDVVSGSFQAQWDGTEPGGQRVPPGLYVYRITVHGDSGEEARIGVVGVAY